MRKWIDLITESPIQSIDLFGDWSSDHDEPRPLASNNAVIGRTNSFVSKVDRRLITNPIIQDRVMKLAKGIKPKLFLYLVNDPELLRQFLKINLDYGRVDDDEMLNANFSTEMITMIRQRQTQKNIQVILTHNDGGDVRAPLTPWIVIHRIAHAICHQGHQFHEKDEIIGSKLSKTITSNYYANESDKMSGYRDWSYQDCINNAVQQVLIKLCTFKSARENNLLIDEDTELEIWIELMTQFMVSGRITFNELPRTLPISRKGEIRSITAKDDLHYEKAKSLIVKIEKMINTLCSKTIRDSAGGIFVC